MDATRIVGWSRKTRAAGRARRAYRHFMGASVKAVRKSLLLCAVALACALSGTLPAAAAEPQAASAPPTSCYTVLNKVKPGQAASDVVAQGCQSGTARPQAAAADTSVVLVKFFQNTNYGGNTYTVFGAQGPCDALGYSLRDSTAINTQVGGISSYTTASACNGHRIYNQTQFGGTPAGFSGYQVASVGANYDNKVLSMKLFNLFDQP